MALTQISNTNPVIARILRQTEALSIGQRKELVKLLIDSLEFSSIPTPPKRHLSELRGLGKELWVNVGAQEYVNQLRDEWDETE